MSGRAWNGASQRVEIACQVRKARDSRVPWKVLERLYGRSRKQLARYASSHGVRQMTQQSSKCPILGASGTGARDDVFTGSV